MGSAPLLLAPASCRRPHSTRLVCSVSASHSEPTAPVEVNTLPPGVWPASAHRLDSGSVSGGCVSVGGVSLPQLREQVGTPVFVIDEDDVRARARRTLAAFESAAATHGASARVYYAGKAFLCVEMVRWMMNAGLRVDVCSGGELMLAQAAGADPALLGFHGNNKSVAELELAVSAGVGTIVLDSDIELERVAAIAERLGVTQSVMVRVNSGVHAQTHNYLATAHEDQKFGISLAAAPAAVQRIREIDALRFVGLHCHIGSQIFGAEGFRESAARLIELHAELAADGDVPILNLGGGFGIAYTEADDPTDIETLAEAIVSAVADECSVRGVPIPELAFEPGRIIVGPPGITLYEVGTVKPVQVDEELTRLYVSVDGGMSDNARPALYDAKYSARIVSRESDAEPALARVVGMHCEAGDIVVDSEYLPADVVPGDLLAVPGTGAYCHALASNYNLVPRPPVVAVSDGEIRVLIRRETISDILARDLSAVAAGFSEPTTEGRND